MSVIPTEYKLLGLAALIAGLLGYHFIAVHHARQSGLEKGRQEVRDEWGKERAKQSQDLLEHNAAVREEEKRRIIAQEQIDRDNQTRVSNSDKRIADLNSQLDRLRKYATTAHPTNQRLPGSEATTFVCTADQESRELLRICANRLIERYAGYSKLANEGADAARRGIACQSWYESGSPGLTKPTAQD